MTVRLAFILGMPRSGTTWLGVRLAAHPDVAVFGETDFWGRSYIRPDATGNYTRAQLEAVGTAQRVKDWSTTTGDRKPARGILSNGVYGQLVAERLAALTTPIDPGCTFEALAAAVAGHRGAALAVEKTPGHILFLDRFADRFPEARFIALHRDAPGFIHSLRHERDRVNGSTAAAFVRFARHPALVAWMWQRYRKAVDLAVARLGDRLIIIHLDEITKSPEMVLARVQAHLGVAALALPIGTGAVNSSFSGQAGPSPDPIVRFWLGQVCGVGAAESVTMRASAAIAASALTLPISAAMLGWLSLREASDPFGYVLGFAGLRDGSR